jgi:hypothetical protein
MDYGGGFHIAVHRCRTVAKTRLAGQDRGCFSIAMTRLYRVINLARPVFSLVLLAAMVGCADDPAVRHANPPHPTPLNASYPFEGGDTIVQLVNGRAQTPVAPGSGAVVQTAIWGEPNIADFSGDGRDDAALILIQDSGGSGTFYYLAVAIREGDGFRGVDSVFLGDRIDPQRIDISGNRITVRYLDRKTGSAMSVPPSQPGKRTFLYDSAENHLAIVAEDFGGEADPARMNLLMKTWVWQRTQYNNDTVVKPIATGPFTIQFTADQRVLVTTDCNNMQGGYETDGNRLGFSRLVGTLMHCEGSMEGVFAGDLEKVSGYLFTRRGELILELKYDTGSMIFR